MKKLLLLVMSIFMLVGCTACGNETKSVDYSDVKKESSAEAAPVQESKLVVNKDGDGKSLVVYFSVSGNTGKLANNLADAIKADKYALQPEKPYTREDLNYNDESTRATVEQRDSAARPKLAGSVGDISKYEKIYVGYPIWWGLAPKLLYTFVESCDFSGKTIIPFCTSGGSGVGSSVDDLKAVSKGNANWKEGTRFEPSATADELKAWAEAQ